LVSKDGKHHVYAPGVYFRSGLGASVDGTVRPLLAWLELANIPYEQVIENDSRKWPKGKNPGVELDGERIGDSEIIIGLLAKRHGIDLDAGLTAEQRAAGLAWRRTFEEHFHQVLEWELFSHPTGAAYIDAAVAKQLPPVVRTVVSGMLRSHFRKQLYARGIARHDPETVVGKGRADVDALAAWLGDRAYLVADHPTNGDVAVFGLLAPMVYWTMPTPVAGYVRSVPAVAAYCKRMRQRCFGEMRAAA
jgi:glutathione S-transferase